MSGVVSANTLLVGTRAVVFTGDECLPESWAARCSPAGTSGRPCHSPFHAESVPQMNGRGWSEWQVSFTAESTAFRQPQVSLLASTSVASNWGDCSDRLSILNLYSGGTLGVSRKILSPKVQRRSSPILSISGKFAAPHTSQTPAVAGTGNCSSSQYSSLSCRALGDHFVGRGQSGVAFGSINGISDVRLFSPSDRDSERMGGRGGRRWWPHIGLPLAYHIHSTTSARPRSAAEQDVKQRKMHRHCVPSFRDTPPKRDTGIASEKDWNINLKNQPINESGLNEDGSTWFRESGEDLGENGFRSRWTVMGGRSGDGTVEWKETWWEKSDWTSYKELGAEKSGRNTLGDSWWETWQEVYRQDEWSGLARIEKSAHKQAKSRNGGVWNEKWWEKYNAKGWAEKGAHKYGKLNDQGWWEKWGEQYDGQGAVIKWTDKWAESDSGTKWGDKWDERFNNGIGMRQGETWHVAASGNRWSRTWGEEHFGTGEVHKYGKSTSGELWDIKVKEPTYYEAEPHYGWADAVVNSLQLLSIEIREKPQDIVPYSDLDTLG